MAGHACRRRTERSRRRASSASPIRRPRPGSARSAGRSRYSGGLILRVPRACSPVRGFPSNREGRAPPATAPHFRRLEPGVMRCLISALSGPDEFASSQAKGWGGTMKGVSLGVVMAITCTLAHAEDMAGMISRYRREHGLSTVKTDPQLTAIAERQAKAMAASGIMDHSVAGSFASRISGARAGMAAENIAAGTKTWAETFRMWQTSPGHNANLLQSKADSVGVAVARNDQTRYKTFWAMVIAEKSPKTKDRKVAAEAGILERRESLGTSENPISTLKNFVCKYLC